MRRLGAALLALAAAAHAHTVTAAGVAPIGWEAAFADSAPVKVRSVRVELSENGMTAGLRLIGAWKLSGDHRAFGGFSGLVVRDGRLMASSDAGWWLDARIWRDGDELTLRNVRMARMQGADGRTYTKEEGDAEGLALTATGLAVSFERDHRVMWLGADGRMGRTIKSAGFARQRENRGIEALVPLADGLLGIGEETWAAEGPVFRVSATGGVAERRLPRIGMHAIVGGDLGPDGRLYLVLRDYIPLLGASVRLMRYALDDQGWPIADSAELLAAFGRTSGIDNMEAVSVERGADGALLLWLISDDNFNPLQRTLLTLLELAE